MCLLRGREARCACFHNKRFLARRGNNPPNQGAEEVRDALNAFLQESGRKQHYADFRLTPETLAEEPIEREPGNWVFRYGTVLKYPDHVEVWYSRLFGRVEEHMLTFVLREREGGYEVNDCGVTEFHLAPE